MAAPDVQSTPWSYADGVMAKCCTYTGLLGDAASHELEIAITSTRSRITGLLEPHLKMMLTPNPLTDTYVPEPVLGSLQVPGSPFEFPTVPIALEHTKGNAVTFATTTVLDAETFVELISSGQDMQFVLTGHNGPVLTLPIPNEPEVINVLRKALD